MQGTVTSGSVISDEVASPEELAEIMKTGKDKEVLGRVFLEFLDTLREEKAQWPLFLKFLDDDYGRNDPSGKLIEAQDCLKECVHRVSAILTELAKFPPVAKQHPVYRSLLSSKDNIERCLSTLKLVDELCEQLFLMASKHV